MIQLPGGQWIRPRAILPPARQRPTVLLSTTTAWNCGDDWIREGLLRALNFRPEVRILWWNRGWGVRDRYQNALEVNLPLADLIVMAGTPEWVDRNERLYLYALENGVPIVLLGVGRTGGYIPVLHDSLLGAVTDAGLIKLAIARDRIAAGILADFAIEAPVMSDPALFIKPVGEGGNVSVVGYRALKVPGENEAYTPPPGGNTAKFDRALQRAFWARPRPKIVTAHDNREVMGAQKLFPANAVTFHSNHARLLEAYGQCSYYIGARIHGFVPALVHGAAAHLIYPSDKAVVAETIIDRLKLAGSARVDRMDQVGLVEADHSLEPLGFKEMQKRIGAELAKFRLLCRSVPELEAIMEPA